MKEDFADIVDYKFTARMESQLDEVEAGVTPMLAVLREFWEGFSRELAAAEEKNKYEPPAPTPVETDIICDKCGAVMIVKSGRYGKFAACPNYPECKNTKPLEGNKSAEKKERVIADFKCELCGGDMVLRQGRYGSFFACANYPRCKFIKQQKNKLEGVSCPKCGGDVLVKQGKNKSVFYSCERYPECDWSSWDMPTAEKCPECGEILFRKKNRDGSLYCRNKDCGYSKVVVSEAMQDPQNVPAAPADLESEAERFMSGVELPPPPGDEDAPF